MGMSEALRREHARKSGTEAVWPKARPRLEGLFLFWAELAGAVPGHAPARLRGPLHKSPFRWLFRGRGSETPIFTCAGREHGARLG
jgi:hypothetical protein